MDLLPEVGSDVETGDLTHTHTHTHTQTHIPQEDRKRFITHILSLFERSRVGSQACLKMACESRKGDWLWLLLG